MNEHTAKDWWIHGDQKRLWMRVEWTAFHLLCEGWYEQVNFPIQICFTGQNQVKRIQQIKLDVNKTEQSVLVRLCWVRKVEKTNPWDYLDWRKLNEDEIDHIRKGKFNKEQRRRTQVIEHSSEFHSMMESLWMRVELAAFHLVCEGWRKYMKTLSYHKRQWKWMDDQTKGEWVK